MTQSFQDTRPPYPGNSKIYIDKEIINGKGLMYPIWGTNPFQTSLNAEEHRTVLRRRARIVNDAIVRAPKGLAPSNW